MLKIPRRIARAPIVLYRLGLGGLLGRRFVLLEHRGRRSGQVRQVVLETISVDPEVIHVVSGYGEQAQWLRNVRADPRVRATCGWARPRAGRAQILPAAEGTAVLQDYRRRHPLAARILGHTLGLPALPAEEPLPIEIGEHLLIVRLTLRK